MIIYSLALLFVHIFLSFSQSSKTKCLHLNFSGTFTGKRETVGRTEAKFYGEVPSSSTCDRSSKINVGNIDCDVAHPVQAG